jgi:hypothetical protein
VSLRALRRPASGARPTRRGSDRRRPAPRPCGPPPRAHSGHASAATVTIGSTRESLDAASSARRFRLSVTTTASGPEPCRTPPLPGIRRESILEDLELEAQLTHERMLCGDLLEHLQAGAVMLELGLRGCVAGVKDVFAAGRSAAQLAHLGGVARRARGAQTRTPSALAAGHAGSSAHPWRRYLSASRQARLAQPDEQIVVPELSRLQPTGQAFVVSCESRRALRCAVVVLVTLV